MLAQLITIIFFLFASVIAQADNGTVTPAIQAPPTTNVKLDVQSSYGTILQSNAHVFGENLFGSHCSLPTMTNFNPDYHIAIGDKISIQLWGAYQFNQVLTVDTQGNIFIPEVGPVRVLGIKNSELNGVVTRGLKNVFRKNVGNYANLMTAQPVQVYVTGFVKNPGLYDGLSSDSVIYFLCKAGGINPLEGSFRNVVVMRNDRLLSQIDLYDFLLHGSIAQFQMHQGDTVVVKPIRSTAKVLGEVNSPYQYEFPTPSISLTQLEQYAGVKPNVTYVRIQKNRGTIPDVKYLPIQLAQNAQVNNGDAVTFVSDQQPTDLLVTLTGQIFGPHEFVVKRGTTLSQLIHRIQFTQQANVTNLQLFRQSVAVQQKNAIDASLASLEKRILISTAPTAEGAEIQAREASLVMQFIENAKHVQPKGQVVLLNYRSWDDVILENNDAINVPEITNVITIGGQVMTPTSVTMHPNYTLIDYVNAAGGFTDTADQSNIIVLHQNGTVFLTKANGFYKWREVFRGGDQIIVAPKPYSQHLQIASAISKILYEVAFAAKVAILD